MKFNQICRLGAASALSLAACLGLTACSRDYTVAFLYVTSSKAASTANPNGTMNEYGIDYQTGSLIRLASSGQDTGGRNPVGVVVTANQKNVVVINRDDSNIVTFKIGTDGKLYGNKTTTVAGSFPTALAFSGDGKFLYVTFAFQPGYTTANPGPGGVEIFPVSYVSDDSSSDKVFAVLGTPVANGSLNYFPLGFNPAGIAVTNNVSNTTVTSINDPGCDDTKCSSYVYVIDQDGNTTNNLLAFRRTLASGVITPVGATTIAPGPGTSTGYNSGVLASGIAATPSGKFLYITDKSANQVIGYTILSTGVPQAILSGPFPTQSQPVGLTIDPRGSFLYTANFNANTVGAYAIATGTGALSATSTGSQSTGGVGPTCVTIENALGIYLYTSNSLDNTVGGLQLKPATGELVKIRNTPFPAAAGPSCAAAVGNGEHSTQLVQP